MTELFADVSKQVKDRTKFWVDIALLNPDPMARAQEILKFRNSLEREDEKEFVDFFDFLFRKITNNPNFSR